MSSKTTMTSSKTIQTEPSIKKTISSFIPTGGTSGITATILSFIRLVIIVLIIISLLFLYSSGGTITAYTMLVTLLLVGATFLMATNQSNLGGLYNSGFILMMWVMIISIALFLTKPLITNEGQQKTMQNLAIWMFSLFILSVLVPSIFTTTGGIIQFLLKHFGTVMKFIIVIASFFTLLGITLSWSFFTTKTKIISGIVIALLIMLYTSGKDLIAYFVANRDFMFINLLLLAMLGVGNYFIYTKASETFGIVTMILSAIFALSWLYLYFIKYKNIEGGLTFNLMMGDLLQGNMMCTSIKEIIIQLITKFIFIIFAFYVAFIYYIYKYKVFKFLETYQTLSVTGFLLIGLLLILGMMYSIKSPNDINNAENTAGQYLSFIGGILGKLLMIAVVLFLVFYIVYSLSKVKSALNATLYFINILLLVIFFAIIIQYFRGGSGKTKSPTGGFFGFLYNLVTFIPCLFIEFIENIQRAYGDINRERTLSIIVLIEIILIGMKFLLPYIFARAINNNALVLTKQVLPTEQRTPIPVPFYLSESTKPIYNYGVSSWIYIHPVPNNTNESYLENTMLYTLGGMPTLNYNAQKNTIIFTMDVVNENGGKKTIIIPGKDISIPLQRWNHVFVNCVESNFDVFLNGELVLTEQNVIPYGVPRGITVGSDPGIYGELCSLVYYKKPLLESEIKILYKSLSMNNPPVIS